MTTFGYAVPGAVVGGLLIGIIESFVGGSQFSSYRDAIAFIMLVIVLLVRPAGLFGRALGCRAARLRLAAAVGIGVTMQLPMDIRIASESARFGFVFARRGLVPEAASSWFLPRAVGSSKAREMAFTGDMIEAEAQGLGLVSQVVGVDDELDGAGRQFTRSEQFPVAPCRAELLGVVDRPARRRAAGWRGARPPYRGEAARGQRPAGRWRRQQPALRRRRGRSVTSLSMEAFPWIPPWVLRPSRTTPSGSVKVRTVVAATSFA